MPLRREFVLDTAQWAWETPGEEIYIGLSNGTWNAETGTDVDIVGTELLETRLLATVTVTEDTLNNEVDLNLAASDTPASAITFNRCTVWRGTSGVNGVLSCTINGDGETFDFTLPVGWVAPVDGDRVVYDGAEYTTNTTTPTSFKLGSLTGLTPGAATVYFGSAVLAAAIQFPQTYNFSAGLAYNVIIDGTSLTT